MTRNMVFGSLGAAILVAVLSIVDIATGFPFAGRMMLDVMFLIGAGLVGYMGWDAYRDISR